MSYIERETLKTMFSSNNKPLEAAICSVIDSAPTVPAEVVVHCRECQYWSGDRDTDGTWGDCEKIGERDNEGGASFDCSTCYSDYCSEGKRRESEERHE